MRNKREKRLVRKILYRSIDDESANILYEYDTDKLREYKSGLMNGYEDIEIVLYRVELIKLNIKDMIMIADYIDDKKIEIKKSTLELKKFYNIASRHQENKLEIICYKIIEKYLRTPMALLVCGSHCERKHIN